MKILNLMNALISILITSVITISFTGCGGGSSGATAPDTEIVVVTVVDEEVVVINTNTNNGVILNLDYNTVDTDGDGMTDIAEVKYGFDPMDASSFPVIQDTIPTYIPEQITITGTDIGAWIEVTEDGIIIKWNNGTDIAYTLKLDNDASSIYYGGHDLESATINYSDFSLDGNEVLVGYFTEYTPSTGVVVSTKSTFNLDLNDYTLLVTPVIGDINNRISFTYEDFNTTSTEVYNEFLKRVWPIMLDRLGPPAENFNCVITNMGAESQFFMIVDDGRIFLSTQAFIPRLIVHEFIHAWKGKYLITADDEWGYHTDLSGFEEGLAEGYAFEIIHEYTKAYPTDSATEQLLDAKAYQYHSSHTNHIDIVRHQRNTGAGNFWTTTGSYLYRYNVAATIVQYIVKEYPNFYTDTQAKIYTEINSDEAWRPTRTNILDIWSQVAPTVQGIELAKYIDALPVFKGDALEDGFYIQNITRQYGGDGDQQFSIAYVLNGREWWALEEKDIGSVTIPSEVSYIIGDDTWVYPDMQTQPYSYDVYTDNELVITSSSITSGSYSDLGIPTSLGWDMPSDLDQDEFELGLYRADLTFTNFSDYNGSSESFYFFGYGDGEYNLDGTTLLIGIDTTVSDLNMTVNIDGLISTVGVNNSLGYFEFTNELPAGYETVMNIDVATADKVCSYKRTLLDSYTLWERLEFGYVIIDKDFNCIEDIYE